jgi:ABC-type hemin transport system substrate-binding protein
VALAPAAHSEPTRDTSRIISIGGAVPEILYALGLEQRIVAVDATSDRTLVVAGPALALTCAPIRAAACNGPHGQHWHVAAPLS